MKPFYTIKKAANSDLYFELSSIDNSMQTKVFTLNSVRPMQKLPRAWALGIFNDTDTYDFWQRGLFVIEEHDEFMQDAIDSGLFFENKIPPKKDEFIVENTLKTLKSGIRKNIDALFTTVEPSIVIEVAAKNKDSLTSGVIKILEDHYKTSLSVEEE